MTQSIIIAIIVITRATKAIREEKRKPMRCEARAVRKERNATPHAIGWRMSARERLCVAVAVELDMVTPSSCSTIRPS